MSVTPEGRQQGANHRWHARTGKSDFARKYLKKCSRVRMVGREKHREVKEQFTTQKVPLHVSSWRDYVIWLPVDQWCSSMMWLLTLAPRWIVGCKGRCSLLWVSQNTSKLIGQHFWVQMDNDHKQTAKVTQDFLKVKHSSVDKSVTWSQPSAACFPGTED